jgi:hypothetical protein
MIRSRSNFSKRNQILVACFIINVCPDTERKLLVIIRVFIYQLMKKRVALKNIQIYTKTAPKFFGLITIITERII